MDELIKELNAKYKHIDYYKFYSIIDAIQKIKELKAQSYQIYTIAEYSDFDMPYLLRTTAEDRKKIYLSKGWIAALIVIQAYPSVIAVT